MQMRKVNVVTVLQCWAVYSALLSGLIGSNFPQFSDIDWLCSRPFKVFGLLVLKGTYIEIYIDKFLSRSEFYILRNQTNLRAMEIHLIVACIAKFLNWVLHKGYIAINENQSIKRYHAYHKVCKLSDAYYRCYDGLNFVYYLPWKLVYISRVCRGLRRRSEVESSFPVLRIGSGHLNNFFDN